MKDLKSKIIITTSLDCQLNVSTLCHRLRQREIWNNVISLHQYLYFKFIWQESFIQSMRSVKRANYMFFACINFDGQSTWVNVVWCFLQQELNTHQCFFHWQYQCNLSKSYLRQLAIIILVLIEWNKNDFLNYISI